METRSGKKYREFERLCFERGVCYSKIASRLGISAKALKNKRYGKSSFTWDEACKIQEYFFPDVDKDRIFKC